MKYGQHDPNESEDRARMMVAIMVSLLILLGFQFFFPKKPMPQQEQAAALATAPVVTAKPSVVSGPGEVEQGRAQTLAESSRIPIRSSRLKGSLSLKGARLDDLLLEGHFTTTEKKENVALLSPVGSSGAYYVDSGFLSAQEKLSLPGPGTLWRVAPGSPRAIEGGGAPVILQWDNGRGLSFERKIALDENYLFTVTQRVVNNTANDISLSAYHLTARRGVPKDFTGFFVLHEGPVSFLNGKLEETDYKKLAKGKFLEKDGVKGWLGITDKYWLTALLPAPGKTFNARIVADGEEGQTPLFQADTVSPPEVVPAGGVLEEKSHLYAGVKDVKLMQAYERKHGFERLELGIDFGMWYFITKPFFYLLHFLIGMSGSVALSILLMTVVVRGAVFPLASKSFRSMAKMRVVGPQMKELQDKYKNDKAKLQEEIYELYKKEDVNPFSGCWPLLIQIPIFFALYKVILISVDLRHAPFWGWIHDLSAPDPTTILNLFGLIHWTPPAAMQPVSIGAWPVLFCLSMILQKRISPPMADPAQEKLQAWFPYIVTVMLAHFASGLVIYWTWSNILGTLQQFYILKKVGGEETSLIRGHAQRRKKKHKPE